MASSSLDENQNEITSASPQKSPPKTLQQFRSSCPAVKRLLREAAELSCQESSVGSLYAAQPLEDNLFEWHFTIRGAFDSEFEGGIYHGRITFPTDYPMKPPSFSFFTPNGRFATGEKICLSISDHHPETWLPSWSIRTALLAIISFMTSPGNLGNIGELNYPLKDRKILAKRSMDWKCPTCGINKDVLPPAVIKVQVKEDAKLAAKKESSPIIDLQPAKEIKEEVPKIAIVSMSPTSASNVAYSKTEIEENLPKENPTLEGSIEANLSIKVDEIVAATPLIEEDTKKSLPELVTIIPPTPTPTPKEISNYMSIPIPRQAPLSSAEQPGRIQQSSEANDNERMNRIRNRSNRILNQRSHERIETVQLAQTFPKRFWYDVLIGSVVTIIIGLFLRRLSVILPNLDFGLF